MSPNLITTLLQDVKLMFLFLKHHNIINNKICKAKVALQIKVELFSAPPDNKTTEHMKDALRKLSVCYHSPQNSSPKCNKQTVASDSASQRKRTCWRAACVETN